jgi:hypothetical protein
MSASCVSCNAAPVAVHPVAASLPYVSKVGDAGPGLPTAQPLLPPGQGTQVNQLA